MDRMLTDAEMAKMTDHELLSAAEKELNGAKRALIASCICCGIVALLFVIRYMI